MTSSTNAPGSSNLLDEQRRQAKGLVDKIMQDEAFRTQFEQDPEGALRAAGVADEIAATNAQHLESTGGEGGAAVFGERFSSECCITVIY